MVNNRKCVLWVTIYTLDTILTRRSPMARIESMYKASKKYDAEKVERITFRVPKGEKAMIQAFASKKGESLSGLLNRLIRKRTITARPRT